MSLKIKSNINSDELSRANAMIKSFDVKTGDKQWQVA